MNSGTAEQEQNGVTIPKPAAASVPRQDAASGQRAADPLGRDERAQERDER